MAKTFCSKCCKEQSYTKITRPVKYGINDKFFAMIDGIYYVCNVCGSDVNEAESSAEREKLAREEIKKQETKPKKVINKEEPEVITGDEEEEGA